VELINHFKVFFETFIKPRKDLQLEGNFLEGDDRFPNEAILQILKVTLIILENCANKYLYNSNEVVFHPILHFFAFFFLLLEHYFLL
jgi:E3 ubiquitin-protein ligase HUWE1